MIDCMATSEVETVSAARAELTETLKRFRSTKAPKPVIFGSHRRPEAVIIPFEQFTANRRDAGGTVLDFLRANAGIIRRFAQVNNVSNVRVYGSVARGEERPESDVDLIVTPNEFTSMFDLAQFASDIELLVERPIDVVSDRALDTPRDQQVLRDAVPL